MDITSANDGSTTAPCALHDSQIELAIEIQIDELIDGAPPPDWNDPAAIAARREQLTDTACRAARATIELLVHARLIAARGVQASVADPPVIAAARAIEALHRALCSYRRNTGRPDALQAAERAMVAEAGAGVAAVATELLTRLRDDLVERMLAIGPPRAD